MGPVVSISIDIISFKKCLKGFIDSIECIENIRYYTMLMEDILELNICRDNRNVQKIIPD